uniref:Uncharacterized protein n=1 Tax=Arion vulgaris TaxID=1028688 RepID=A0A0B7BA08_9EUPU
MPGQLIKVLCNGHGTSTRKLNARQLDTGISVGKHQTCQKIADKRTPIPITSVV